MTLEVLILLEVGHMFSCCESCVKKKRYKQIILIVSFVLMTFDVVTDWLNWIEWKEVGGYDQYYFVSIFQNFFLTVATVGTGLWILELFVLTKKFISVFRKYSEGNPLVDERGSQECLPNLDTPDDLISLSESELQIFNKKEVGKDDGYILEHDIRKCLESGSNDAHSHSEINLSNCNDSLAQSEVMDCSEREEMNDSEK